MRGDIAKFQRDEWMLWRRINWCSMQDELFIQDRQVKKDQKKYVYSISSYLKLQVDIDIFAQRVSIQTIME